MEYVGALVAVFFALFVGTKVLKKRYGKSKKRGRQNGRRFFVF